MLLYSPNKLYSDIIIKKDEVIVRLAFFGYPVEDSIYKSQQKPKRNLVFSNVKNNLIEDFKGKK